MFYVAPILLEILYYYDIDKYFNKICNYLQQYKWHNDVIEASKYKDYLDGCNSTVNKIHGRIANYYNICKISSIPRGCLPQRNFIYFEVNNDKIVISNKVKTRFTIKWDNILKYFINIQPVKMQLNCYVGDDIIIQNTKINIDQENKGHTISIDNGPIIRTAICPISDQIYKKYFFTNDAFEYIITKYNNYETVHSCGMYDYDRTGQYYCNHKYC
jgi:hypothetical protein